MIRLGLAVMALTATAALGQLPSGSSDAPRARQGGAGDPNQIVCVRQNEVGSRLARRRVCRTRSEWQQHQAEFKREVESAQQQMESRYTDPDPPAFKPQ